MKIVVVGLGYVGLSNAVLLAQHNEVIGVDISQERVDTLGARKSPIIDAELSKYLTEKKLNLSTSTNLQTSVVNADFVIVCTPTDFDEKRNSFDTSTVETVIAQVTKYEPNACIVVKSTVPVGFINDVRKRLETDAVIFSPEFLREGQALHDNLFPSRIIIGEKSKRAKVFADLLVQGAVKEDIDILLIDPREAEAIKLFANSYLAMRVGFFNELDSFALMSGLNSRDIIEGVSSDPRIGKNYNNPSFGYGGYCLPKDTKQLLTHFDGVPQNIIKAIVDTNSTRKTFLANEIIKRKPNTIGIYRLVMKANSDNFRYSAVQGLLRRFKAQGIEVVIYEPAITTKYHLGCCVIRKLDLFKLEADIILANRLDSEILDAGDKIFSRDIFGSS